MPIFHISTPIADWTQEQITDLREFMRERGIGENTVRHYADGPFLYSILIDETRTLEQVRDWLIAQFWATFHFHAGFALEETALEPR